MAHWISHLFQRLPLSSSLLFREAASLSLPSSSLSFVSLYSTLLLSLLLLEEQEIKSERERERKKVRKRERDLLIIAINIVITSCLSLSLCVRDEGNGVRRCMLNRGFVKKKVNIHILI